MNTEFDTKYVTSWNKVKIYMHAMPVFEQVYDLVQSYCY